MEAQYVSIFPKEGGIRITSFVVGVHADTIDELEELARKQYPDARYVRQTEAEWAANMFKIYNAATDTFDDPTFAEENPATVIADRVRQKRNSLLAATDYLLMPDYPISEKGLAAIKAYRQALRDIPAQAGFPDDVVWPQITAA